MWNKHPSRPEMPTPPMMVDTNDQQTGTPNQPAAQCLVF
jgi:hypothetical protein